MHQFYDKFVRRDLEEFYYDFFMEAKQKMSKSLEIINNISIINGETDKNEVTNIHIRLAFFPNEYEYGTWLYPNYISREVCTYVLRSNTLIADNYHGCENRWYGPEVTSKVNKFSKNKYCFDIPIDCMYIHDSEVDPYGHCTIDYTKFNHDYYAKMYNDIKKLKPKNKTYFLNLKTNECSCKSYKYRKNCKHYKVAFEYKSKLFRNMCLVFNQYMSIGCALDIVDGFLFG